VSWAGDPVRLDPVDECLIDTTAAHPRRRTAHDHERRTVLNHLFGASARSILIGGFPVMTTLARWCFRHRLSVIGIWVALLIAVAVPYALLGAKYNDTFDLPGMESTTAQKLLQASAPAQAGDSDQIVVRARQGSINDPAVRNKVSAMLKTVAGLPSVSSVSSMYGPRGQAQISKDATIGYATVTFDAAADQIPVADITRVINTAQAVGDQNLQVELGGAAVATAAEVAAPSSEYIGVLAAGVILFIAFGSLLGMLVPLLVAIAGLGVGIISIGLLSRVMTLGTDSPTVAALIGLGVGIDYALFIVTRYRTGLREGLTPEDAAVRAVDTSGRAVLFAGGTVVVAMLGLLVLRIGPTTGLGISAAITVLSTVIAAVTLLPALFGLFRGKLINRRQRRAVASGALPAQSSGLWARWADLIARRKTVSSVVAVLVILVLSIPALSLRLGSADAGNDPKGSTTRAAYDLLARGFGPGSNGPLVVVAQLDGASDAKAVNGLVRDIRDTTGVTSVAAAPATATTKLAVIEVIPDSAPQAEATSTLIDQLRRDVIPAAEKGSTLQVYVGGSTATYNDFSQVLTGKLPLFLGVIVLLGCLLLMIAFRSIVIPLTAAVMNLLASAASFGVVVAVFQWGWGSELLGVGKAGPVEAVLPVIMLAILFGLSMDYQVFLVSRMHEEWTHTRDNRRAVRVGQAETGRMITAAALIMICVFMAFVFGGQRTIAQFGVGLAAAVTIDAFVLRTVLVPAVMHLFGRANWWLPNWLDRILPNVSIEGPPTPTPPPLPVTTEPAPLRTAVSLVSPPQTFVAVGLPQHPIAVVDRPLPTKSVAPSAGPKGTQPKPKSIVIGYLWWTFFGLFGAHQFYLGKKGRGYLYLCTLGLCGLGWLLDLFTLPRQTKGMNAALRVRV
jgi:RND superfamily putative drug exporter